MRYKVTMIDKFGKLYEETIIANNEYEAKINSGDPISIAEVVRDLHRNVGQPDQSFSERQIYEAARDRLAAEVAAVDKTDVEVATEKLEKVLEAA